MCRSPGSSSTSCSTTRWAGWIDRGRKRRREGSQRVDILVVRLEAQPGPVEKLHSILDYLAAHTLIEYKGPTDDLGGEDVLVLLGYAYQYMRRAKLKHPGEVCLMVIADRITKSFLDQAKHCGVELAEVDRGIWRGSFAGFVLHGVETGKASERGPTEHLLYTFSRWFLADPARARPLDEEEAKLYDWLYQQVKQFERERGTMAVKDMETFERSMMRLFESISADHPELVDHILARCSPEELRQRLAPEERVRGLSPEELVRCLSPEEREQVKRLLH